MLIPNNTTFNIFYLYSYKNRVVDDGVPAILHYSPSDLYLADSKETLMVEVGNNHDCRFLLK